MTEKKFASYEATMVPLGRSKYHPSANACRTVQSKGSIDNTAFKSGFEIVKFVSKHVVQSQLFASVCERCQQWLSDMDLIQMSAFGAS
jgi:hypothetical protein